MDNSISEKFGLIAGDGELPIIMAKSAQEKGHKVIALSLSHTNTKNLNTYCEKVYEIGIGEIQKAINTLKKENITELTFLGKVHKGLLLKNPRLDSRAIKLLKTAKKLNDDSLMLAIINELEQDEIKVMNQTIFIKELLVKKGVLGKHEPTEEEVATIEYAFNIAKEIGRLDLGQTVVAKNKMIMAVETIEGTDRAIERGCKLAKKDAIVVKVSKPGQDQRFDIPTAGLNTLKNIKRFKGRILAVEASETFIVQKEEMIKFADANKMVLVAV